MEPRHTHEGVSRFADRSGKVCVHGPVSTDQDLVDESQEDMELPKVHRAASGASCCRRDSLASTATEAVDVDEVDGKAVITPASRYTSYSTQFQSDADGEEEELQDDEATISDASSSVTWRNPESVLFFVDWDDTLCPTTWLAAKPGFEGWVEDRVSAEDLLTAEERALLEELDQSARGFLIAASRWGKVVCVTLATRWWQAKTMEAFLPRLASAWRELGVQVHAVQDEHSVIVRRAREALLHPTWATAGEPAGNLERTVFENHVQVLKKKRAMMRALRDFYGAGSWKNIISIGDGHAERGALQDLGFAHTNPRSSWTGDVKSFRIKTVKLIEEPDCMQLSQELQLLQSWSPTLVALDRDFDVALDEGDEDINSSQAQDSLQDLVETCRP